MLTRRSWTIAGTERPTQDELHERPAASFASPPDSYQTWRDQFIAQRLHVLYLVGLVVNPIFLGLDYLAHRDHLGRLFILRVILEVGLLLGYWALRVQLRHIKVEMLLAFWPLFPNILITHMIVLLSTSASTLSTYYNGLGLVLLTAAVIVPVSWPSHLVAQAGSLLYYYSVLSLTGTPVRATGLFIESGYFLVFTCVALQISVVLYERLQRAEFLARVSERLARTELETSNRKLLELDRLKSEFFANISHELRTPLTLIIGGFQALLKNPAIDERHKLSDIGLRNASRLLLLINELLDLAKFDSGIARMKMRCVDLSSLVHQVAGNFDSKPDRIHLEGVSPGVTAELDPLQIKKVLYNLLSNAGKFSDPQFGQIWLTLRATDDLIELTVQDNGIGIAEDHLTRIFDRFTQVEGAASRRYEGTGIGLAVVKEIIDQHKGRISVQSQVGTGTTFNIILPRGHIAAGVADTSEEEGDVLDLLRRSAMSCPDDAREHVAVSSDDHSKPLVLVAEDNPDMRDYLVRLLSPQYRIAQGRDGVEGLNLARMLLPDVILSDVMMPRMSGPDLLGAIRNEPSLRMTPVIFLTARASMEGQVESLEGGANDYITKPFHENELLARIANQLRIRMQDKELEAANAKLRDLDAKKSEFVSIVAHELRSPLTAMKGYADNLLAGIGGTLTEQQSRALDRIGHNIHRLTRLINDLLDLSKIESGKIEVRLQPIQIDHLVRTLMDGFQQVAAEKSLTLQTIISGDVPVVHGDPDQVIQILTNLVQNAMKFTPVGGQITVRLEVLANKSIRICVSDSGCGIPPDEISKVFDRFYRGSAVSSEKRGAGLGLAIVKHLVELHKGQIWVESCPGEGSRFFFTLPSLAE